MRMKMVLAMAILAVLLVIIIPISVYAKRVVDVNRKVCPRGIDRFIAIGRGHVCICGCKGPSIDSPPHHHTHLPTYP